MENKKKYMFIYVTSKLRKNGFREREREREREKGVEKDGAWKDGQTLVSQVFAWKQTPASQTHPLFCPLRNMGQRLVKTL